MERLASYNCRRRRDRGNKKRRKNNQEAHRAIASHVARQERIFHRSVSHKGDGKKEEIENRLYGRKMTGCETRCKRWNMSSCSIGFWKSVRKQWRNEQEGCAFGMRRACFREAPDGQSWND
eukprot:767471-Hanusia_phi.AAC.4